MGYYKNHSGLKSFEPDNTYTKFYLNASCHSFELQDIIDKCKEKWGQDISLSNIHISAEYIHTDCIGFDEYDPSDYTNYLVITYKSES